MGLVPATAHGSTASGGGTYAIGNIPTEFQFSPSHVQCKIGHAVMPDGSVMQMLMFSKSIDSVTIIDNTVTITGTMVSIVNLHSPGSAPVQLSETVPFTAVGQDNGTPGAGVDTFSLTAFYAPGGGQALLFRGTPATFAGTLTTGNIVVR
jgi:hypothetical protein